MAVITWDIPEDAPSGMYRIRHSGYYKPLFQRPKSFTGTTKNFRVGAAFHSRDMSRDHNRVHLFEPTE